MDKKQSWQSASRKKTSVGTVFLGSICYMVWLRNRTVSFLWIRWTWFIGSNWRPVRSDLLFGSGRAIGCSPLVPNEYSYLQWFLPQPVRAESRTFI